jgi:hypothetical protein
MSKPRVGIITFHRAVHYGALLQAFALQEVLKKMGYECIIIDYRNSYLESLYKEMKLADCCNLMDLGRFIFYFKYHNKIHKKFREFSSTYLNKSDAYYSIEELRKIASQYNKFICGSDQVWNYKLTGFEKAYFLDFTEDILKKNSYAASFGFNSIPLEYVEEYRNLLKNFNHISVRESQGSAIVKELIDREAEVVLDPTLLITKHDWEKIAEDYKKKKNYILLYMIGVSPTLKTFVENLSRKTNCEIVYISYSLIRRIKATYERWVGPKEYLGLFKNARYIVTNSFHGTAFSINFNKDFFLEMMPETQDVNSRLKNILELFDLRTRQIINGKNAYIQEPINYNEVNQKLFIERQKSLDFLHKIIRN